MSSSKPLPTQSSNPQNLPTPSPSPSAPSSHQYPHRPPSHSQKQEDDDNRVRSQRLSRQHHQQDQRIIPSLRYPSNRKTIYDRNLNRTRTAELSRSSFAYLFSEIISYAQQNVKGVQDLERRLSLLGLPLGKRLLPLLLHRQFSLPASSTSTTSSSSSSHNNPTPLPPSTASASAVRPTRILPLLTFLSQTLWRHLFSRPLDAIERSSTNPSEYMLTDNECLVCEYVSVPKEIRGFNPGAFVAGIVEGVVAGLGFEMRDGEGRAVGGWRRRRRGDEDREGEGGKGIGRGWEGGGQGGVTAHWVGDEDAGGGGGGSVVGRKTVFLIRFSEEVVRREEAGGR